MSIFRVAPRLEGARRRPTPSLFAAYAIPMLEEGRGHSGIGGGGASPGLDRAIEVLLLPPGLAQRAPGSAISRLGERRDVRGCRRGAAGSFGLQPGHGPR